jgi:hypothetical protein
MRRWSENQDEDHAGSIQNKMVPRQMGNVSLSHGDWLLTQDKKKSSLSTFLAPNYPASIPLANR